MGGSEREGEGKAGRERLAALPADAWCPPPPAHLSQESSGFRGQVLSTYSAYGMEPSRGGQNKIEGSYLVLALQKSSNLASEMEAQN